MAIENPKWAQSPWPILVHNINNFKRGTVLDLGGSDGVNDLYLAEHGFEVTNVDIDQEALQILTQEAKNNNLRIITIHADLNDFIIGEDYDNIITFFTLHFLKKDSALNLIEQIKAHTVNEGLNLIVTFTNHGEFQMSFDHFYPEVSELEELYKDWHITNKATMTGQTKSGKLQERVFFIAKKP